MQLIGTIMKGPKKKYNTTYLYLGVARRFASAWLSAVGRGAPPPDAAFRAAADAIIEAAQRPAGVHLSSPPTGHFVGLR